VLDICRHGVICFPGRLGAFGVRGQAVARLSTSALLACVGTNALECKPSARTQVALHVPWCVSKRACLVPQVQVGGDDVLNEKRLNLRLAVAGALARRMW
jgi:hypothetical protein